MARIGKRFAPFVLVVASVLLACNGGDVGGDGRTNHLLTVLKNGSG